MTPFRFTRIEIATGALVLFMTLAPLAMGMLVPALFPERSAGADAGPPRSLQGGSNAVAVPAQVDTSTTGTLAPAKPRP
jgi:hypothetical protein